MKIYLCSDNYETIAKSGVGKAIKHQIKALEENDIDFTINEKDDFDIIHINTIFPESYMKAIKAKKQGKKVIYHAHSTVEDFRNSFIGSNALAPAFKKWISTCYKTADLIITPTPYSKKLIENYKLNRDIIALSNGIDLNKFKRDSKLGDKFRTNFNFSKDDKVIISVGLYIERKGIIDFVELAKQMPEYKFVWFGYTDLNTVPAKIKDAVNTKLPNLFFPGYVESDILKGAYFGADLFFFPTYEETEGIVLLEALASKIPVLIRDIPIYEGWFIDGVNVYKGKNNKTFKKLIIDITNSKIKNLTEEGYKVAQERDIKIIGKELKKTYTKLLKGN